MSEHATLIDDVSTAFDVDSKVFCVIAPNDYGMLTVRLQIPPHHIDDFRATLNRIDAALSNADK